jgi:hypothetical protein
MPCLPIVLVCLNRCRFMPTPQSRETTNDYSEDIIPTCPTVKLRTSDKRVATLSRGGGSDK